MHMISEDVHLFPMISQSQFCSEVLLAEGTQKSVDEANWREVMSQLSALSELIWENLVTTMDESNTLTHELSFYLELTHKRTANSSAVVYTDAKNQNHVTLK